MNNYTGEIINIDDPLRLGRCKIRIHGLFDDDINIKEEHLPWAICHGTVFGKTGGGNISIPKKGSIVNVYFKNDDINYPVYYNIEHHDKDMLTELKEDYEDSHVLLYDKSQELKIIYTPNNGIKIYLKKSSIVINEDSSITIEHADSKSIIELVGDECNVVTQNKISLTSKSEIEITSKNCKVNGTQLTELGPSPVFSAVAAEPLFQYLKTLAATIDAKWPQTPGISSSLTETAEQLATSKNVKVSK